MSNRKKPKGTKRARVAAKRAERLRNIGPDASGNYGVNPYAARWHVVEVAPKELRSNPNSTQHPKRFVPPIEWYDAHNHIEPKQYRAAKALIEAWGDVAAVAKMTAGYDPVLVQSSPDADGSMIRHIHGKARFRSLMKAVPYHCRGVVEAVVIVEQTAADWARGRGIGCRDSKAHGLKRLRQGLSALALHLGY